MWKIDPSRPLRIVCAIMLMTSLFGSCKEVATKHAAPQPSVAAADPKCKSQSVSNCRDSNPKCAVNGKECAGSLDYCNGFNESTTCPRSSCAWSSTSNACTPGLAAITPASPVTNQCSIHTVTTCASAVGCSWNGTLCVTAGTTPICSSYTAAQCSTIVGCALVNNMCTQAGAVNNCSPNTNQQTCAMASGCAWTGVSCLPADTTIACAAKQTQAQCLPLGVCAWTNGTCVNAQQTNVCSNFLTNATCPTNLGCSWNGVSCIISGSQTTNCTSLAGNASICDSTNGCQWINNNCIASICRPLSFGNCFASPNCTYVLFSGCYPIR
jgi:hypothetical protein